MSVVDTEASYEELSADAPKAAPEEAPEEAPVKRKPGRPPGSKNKPKAPPPEPESVTPEPEPAEPASPAPASPAPAPPAPAPQIPALDVEFDEGPGGAGPPPKSAKTRARKPAQPVRLTRSRTTGGDDYDLLHYVAEAARAYGAQERLKRQDFYNRYLPIG